MRWLMNDGGRSGGISGLEYHSGSCKWSVERDCRESGGRGMEFEVLKTWLWTCMQARICVHILSSTLHGSAVEIDEIRFRNASL